ncbi:unnamed protein product [Lactuca virosa]|uniref:F-box domain-containing protein n=1 Tax=Lactuca virosa TaxID=75947 RepID=A0AAU9LVV4_9ASTR|nr:unnamed protein product [Lactuca virosa]
MSFRSKNEDRLSSLPEEVLSHILSLMPTKFDVRSCILSKRWRQSWMMVTNLDFNESHPTCGLDWFMKFVDRVLELCKTSQVKLFKLHFTRYVVPKSSVSKWIDKVVRLNVCELDINVRRVGLPQSLFTCKTLTKLSLVVSSNHSNFFNLPPLLILPCLKTLYISVHCKHFVLKLIHDCSVLENLSLTMASLDNEDYISNIPTLKRLELTARNCITQSCFECP